MLFGSESIMLALAAILLTVIAMTFNMSRTKHQLATVDALEPPLLRPRIPYVGHILSMIVEKSGFYARILYVIKTLQYWSDCGLIVNKPNHTAGKAVGQSAPCLC